MTVRELIDILNEVRDQDAKIMVKDTAAGFRNIKNITETGDDEKVYNYIINTTKSKKG
ncbi:hypothetical protein [Clostridium butyricum]|uniref:hypothetical protein n=1 Tax=Clostridium butyricum TaxID=1492 RepID=UPI00374E2B02